MTVERLSDYVPGPVGVVKRWLEEIDGAGEWQKKWESQAREIIRRYEGDLTQGASSSFNILHSNTETLRPQLFGQTPQPDIRRRLQMPSTTDREAAEIIERSIRYLNDTHPYEEIVNAALSDYLLTGRGVLRVRYIPTIVRRKEPVEAFENDDGTARFFTANMNEVDPGDVVEVDGNPAIEIEELNFERADLEHTPYCDFRHTPAKRWQDVRWIAFRHLFTREELDQAFGKGVSAKTSTTEQGRMTQNDNNVAPDIFQKAEVWEIWDKVERQILFVSPGNSEGPLATYDDGPEYYNLGEFFPTPEPLRSIHTPSSLLPIPEFIIYQDLADELDEITAKIRDIIETVDVKGAYDGALPELGSIFSTSTKLISVPDWRALTDKGGLAGVMDFVPIEPQVKAFVALTEQRDQLLNTIYQTIGLSDISRGQSDPRETATAQRLKGNFGQARLAPRQRDVQRYLRDLMRIQGELIAEKFESTTLALMSGIQPSPEVEHLLQIDPLRSFAIDIETDSTIAADQQQVQSQLKEMIEGLGALGQAMQSLPDGARMPLLQSVVRKFKLGRDIELALEEASQQPPEPDPEAVQAQQDGQIAQAELQLKSKAQADKMAVDTANVQLKARDLDIKEDQAEAGVIQAAFGNAD